jgi:polysaccharide biosynthesis protein PslG
MLLELLLFALASSRCQAQIVVIDPAAAVIAVPAQVRDLRGRLGVNIHFLQDDHALDLAKDAGFSFVRTDLPWTKLEQHERYEFAPFDDLMRALETRGMGVLWILDYGHPEHGGQSPKSKEDIEAYSRYTAAVVSHFRGHNARFEIWNEPNEKQFLANPAGYPKLLRTALESIRRYDPEAVVSTGGTSGFDLPFLSSMMESGSAQTASAVAVHPYRDSGPETFEPDLLLLRKLIERTLGRNVPVWVTEWGYSSYGGDTNGLLRDGHNDAARMRQAVLTARECLTIWSLGLPVAVLYDLQDDGSNPFDREQNFGLLNQDDRDKPAMSATRALTKVARDHTYSGLVRKVPHGVHAIRLDGADDIVFVIWDADPAVRAQMQFSRDGLLSVSDVLGQSIVLNGGDLILDETMGPVYMRFKRH